MVYFTMNGNDKNILSSFYLFHKNNDRNFLLLDVVFRTKSWFGLFSENRSRHSTTWINRHISSFSDIVILWNKYFENWQTIVEYYKNKKDVLFLPSQVFFFRGNGRTDSHPKEERRCCLQELYLFLHCNHFCVRDQVRVAVRIYNLYPKRRPIQKKHSFLTYILSIEFEWKLSIIIKSKWGYWFNYKYMSCNNKNFQQVRFKSFY